MRRSILAFLLFALGAAAVCVRLGFWQLDRRTERLARNAGITGRMTQAPVALSTLKGDTLVDRYRRVTVTGQPDFDRDLALTLRGNSGSPGVDVLTPIRVAGTDTALLVLRGWIYSPDGMTADLSKWREPDTTFSGYIEAFEVGQPSDSVRLNGIRRMNHAAISRHLPYPIRPYYVVVTDDSTPAKAGTLVRLKTPVLDNGPHMSYAIQWFSFATIAVIGAGIVAARSMRSS